MIAATNTPQQNGVSERVVWTLCSEVRCLLVDRKLPPNLWGELMLTAAYLCNRMPHSRLDMEMPFKQLYGKEAIHRISRSSALELLSTSRMPRSWKPSPGKGCCAASARTKRYRVWNPKTRRMVESRNATFIETPPHLIPQPTRLSPLRELPPA